MPRRLWSGPDANTSPYLRSAALSLGLGLGRRQVGPGAARRRPRSSGRRHDHMLIEKNETARRSRSGSLLKLENRSPRPRLMRGRPAYNATGEPETDLTQ